MKIFSIALLSLLCINTTFAFNSTRNVYNSTGYANGEGSFSAWWYFGETNILLKGGCQLKVRANFSSKQKHHSDSMLGPGWWVAIAESTFTENRTDEFMFRTLGGDAIAFRRSPDNPREVTSTDAKWSGTLETNYASGIVTLKSKTGWSFVFQDRRIISGKTPTDEELKWIYQGEHLQKIVSDLNGDLVTFHYYDNTKRVKKIIAQTADKPTQVDFTYYDIANSGLETVSNSLKSMSCSYGYFCEFVNGKSKDQKKRTLTLHTKNKGKEKTEEFVWDHKSGNIISSPGLTYEIKYPGPKIISKDARGKSHGSSFDPETFIWTIWHREGAVEKRKLISTPGPNQMKPRQITLTYPYNRGVFDTHYEYDKSGQKIKMIENKEVVFKVEKKKGPNGERLLETFERKILPGRRWRQRHFEKTATLVFKDGKYVRYDQ